MNYITREIAQFLEISLEEAVKVQDYLDKWFDIDYSEATQRQMETAYLMAYEEMRERV